MPGRRIWSRVYSIWDRAARDGLVVYLRLTRKARNDTATGCMPPGVAVIAADDDFSGVGFNGAGVSSESFGTGGHHGDIPVG